MSALPSVSGKSQPRTPKPTMSSWSAPGSPACTCCTGCAGWACRSGSTSRAAMSAAPGTGTAIPARAATSRACSIPIRSPTSCSRNGTGASATRRSRRSCNTPTTSPTASTCGRDIQFDTRVDQAAFDESTNAWSVTTSDGNTVTANYVVIATGCLSNARMPDIPGLDDFKGQVYHTGHWPHEGVDFTGQRVGVIGTGSSAIQSIPVIAEQAGHLTVFQRTANFSIPARNAPLTPEERNAFRSNYPEIRRMAREEMRNGIYQELPDRGALDDGDNERRARYEAALGPRRADLHGDLQRPRARQGRQRHRRRFRARQDRRDREGPADRKAAAARTITRSAPSGSASTPTTTRPTTART